MLKLMHGTGISCTLRKGETLAEPLCGVYLGEAMQQLVQPAAKPIKLCRISL